MDTGYQIVVLDDGPPQDLKAASTLAAGSAQGVLESEVLLALRQGSGLIDLRLDPIRATAMAATLSRAGLRARAVALELTQQVPRLEELTEVAVTPQGLERLDPAGPPLAWGTLRGFCAANVKTSALHGLEEQASAWAQREQRGNAGRPLEQRSLVGHALDAQDARRAELGQRREASSPPEPVLDLFFGAPLRWVRLPLARLRFSGPNLTPSFRRNFRTLLEAMAAAAPGAARSAEAIKLLAHADPAKLPLVEEHIHLRFARWLNARKT